jgi:sigma-B regulation protein RsbU (phosphoserine phosphatase)
MTDIVVLDLPESTLRRIGARAGRIPLAASSDQPVADVVDDATLVVACPAPDGIALAQAVHEVAPDVAVVLVADDVAEGNEVRAALAITPGIGRHASCVVWDEPGTLDRIADEVERAHLRLEHRLTLEQVRGEVRPFEWAAPDALSVYLGQLFEHAPLGILLADPDGVVRAANPCSGAVLGWQPRHALGTSLDAMFAGDDADTASLLLRDAVASGGTSEATLTRTGPDGTTQHLEITVAPVDPEHCDLGVFVLLRDESERIQALETAERARLAAEADASRYAELAWTLQESLLPPDLPRIDGIDVGARYHPAGDGAEIGGDFYDIFQVSDEEWFAVMGDICGKGAGAARLTALTRYTLRAATIRTASIEQNLTELNAALVRQYDVDRARNQHRFATATLIRFRREGDDVIVRAGSGGHAPPLIGRADGTVEELPCRGLLLGVFEDAAFVAGEARLGPGDVLVLYTDGVTEARRHGEDFGEDRLRELLASCAGLPAPEVVGMVEETVLTYQSGVARDDIALLAISPAGAARQHRFS